MWKTNLKVLGVTLAVLTLYTGIAKIIPQLRSEVPETLALGPDVTPEALIAAGERTFNGAGGCTACHGLGSRAPNLLTDYADQGTIGARCGTRGADCKTYLFTSLVDPGGYVVEGFQNIMPDMRRGGLSDDQIWAVVAFLQSQGGEVTVTADDLPAAGDEAAPTPSDGGGFSATTDPQELLEELACITCHVLDGQGAQIGPPFDGIGSRVDAARIRRGVLDPAAELAVGFEAFAGVMPANFGTRLSAAQLEAIVQFLASRR